MEYIPEALRQRYKHDQEHDWTFWLEVNGEIAEKHCCRRYLFTSYEELICDLQYPTEGHTEDFQAANYSKEGYTPMLLHGVVIDNALDGSGERYLQIISTEKVSSNDPASILFLQNVSIGQYTVLAWELYSDRTTYTIGDFRNVRPGTKVIISAANLKIASENNNWVKVQITDIARDLDSEYTFVDHNYRIHQSELEYLTLYERIASAKKPAKKETNSSGCYIATAVYHSYDCPEVWTLRRYRDRVLSSTWYGRLFIEIYYRTSPILVRWFGKKEWFVSMGKKMLDPFVRKLKSMGYEDTRYEDK